MWVFWAFVIGVLLVVLGWLAWAVLTVEVTPAHSLRAPTRIERARRAIKGLVRRKPLSRRQQARKEARRGELAARLTRARALLRRRPRPQESRAAEARAVKAGEPGENWASDLRAQLEKDDAADPDRHLQRNWEHRTGAWSRKMLDQMLADGQMPPAPPSHTEEWLARTEQAVEQDAFMGREPANTPEEGSSSA